MELKTSHGCSLSADFDFGFVNISVSHFPVTSSLMLPMKDALLLADMIYAMAGAEDKGNYKEAA
jgi:hypothetical protein